ncbi:MAG: hypothetical protein HY917_03995, partial [Candidatus Diapherotrites archaeon]|nr:hypothetical protein [Candidatus Diapherotrites archaeon]
GINLPAFRVIIPQLYRFGTGGMEPLEVREFKQMSGRAGRPKYDSRGEAVLVARTETESERLREHYIEGEIEPVESRLGEESLQRTILLSAIAGEFVFDLASLESFFGKTFYAAQNKNIRGLFGKLTNTLRELEKMGFIEADEREFKTTKLGRRVSELYLDPLTAHRYLNGLQKPAENPLYYLYLLSDSTESGPWVNVPKAQEARVWEELRREKPNLPVNVDQEMHSDNTILSKFNSALLLREWVEEKTEEQLMKDYSIPPGILFNRLQVTDWLNYAAGELCAFVKDAQTPRMQLARLRKRLKHGIKEELVPLCEFRGIGRVRGRKLFSARIHSAQEIRTTPFEVLAGILGSKTAEALKKQAGTPASPEEKNKWEHAPTEQAELAGFEG